MAEMLCVEGGTIFCSLSKSPHSSIHTQSGPQQAFQQRDKSKAKTFLAWRLYPEHYFHQPLVDLSFMNLSELLANIHATKSHNLSMCWRKKYTYSFVLKFILGSGISQNK